MEFIIILILIILFASVLTGNLGYVLFGMSGFLLIISALMAVTFSACMILLLTSKWKEAKFIGIDIPREGARFKVAFYLVDGEEVPCLFPEEGVFLDKLYREDKTYRVLYHKRLGRVFDRYSVATCVIGMLFGYVFGAVMLALYFI